MFCIEGRQISAEFPPYIIAEISANHNGSLSKAKQCIEAAKVAGASAVKIQTYTADTMTIDSDQEDFIISDGLWSGYKLYDLYQEAHTPFEWHAELFLHAKNIGIPIFSSPFDETAVDLLEDLSAPAYKVASFELCDIPLIKYIAKTKKPILMSTGMASPSDVDAAVQTAMKYGCEQLLLFHCISSYPAPVEEANLSNISFLKDRYHVEVGLSDHTLGTTAAIASVALGATAVEKHFTLSKHDPGPDSAFSIDPKELGQLVKYTKEAWNSLGEGGLIRSETELTNMKFKRSIYFVQSLQRGEIVQEKHIRRIRPGFGLSPQYYDSIIGKRVKTNVERGERVSWDLFE